MFRKGNVLLTSEEMEGEYDSEELRKEVCGIYISCRKLVSDIVASFLRRWSSVLPREPCKMVTSPRTIWHLSFPRHHLSHHHCRPTRTSHPRVLTFAGQGRRVCLFYTRSRISLT